jgi:hypothetical protein
LVSHGETVANECRTGPLHGIAIPRRSIAAGELVRYAVQNEHRTDHHASRARDDVEAQLDAARRLNQGASLDDLPVLLAPLRSAPRQLLGQELLAEQNIRLAGVGALPDLVAALRRNSEEGHDNDAFQASLAELAAEEKGGVRTALEGMRATASKAEREDFEWLVE